MKEFKSAVDMALATLKESGEQLLSEIKEEKEALERRELGTYEMICKMHECRKHERMEMELLAILTLLIDIAKKGGENMIDKKANEVAEEFLSGKGTCKFEEMPIRCTKCGRKLSVYYCENRLYAVRCTMCKSVTLVYAARKLDAARKVGAYEHK